MRLFSVILVFSFAAISASGQKDTARSRIDTLPDRFFVLQKIYRDGESMPEIEIKEVTIVGKGKSRRSFQYNKYQKLVHNVRRVYPYAVIVRKKMEAVNADLEKLPDEKLRKEYLKKVEKEVFRDYEEDMRSLTLTQGKILIKLIDRETKNTSYNLIRDYRGKISAVFWQGIARIFGTNLKEQYDPYGDDAIIERIIEEIEAGRL